MAKFPTKITVTSPTGAELATYTFSVSDTAAPDAISEQRSLADRAKAAYTDDRDALERAARVATRQYRRLLQEIFVWRCATVLDVDATTVEGVSSEVLNNEERFVATGEVDGMSFEVVAHRRTLESAAGRSVAFRGEFQLRVILPCIGCACDRAFYIDSLADLGKVLAVQRCTECGGSIQSALPGYLAVR